jgi:hypothetical protein
MNYAKAHIFFALAEILSIFLPQKKIGKIMQITASKNKQIAKIITKKIF